LRSTDIERIQLENVTAKTQLYSIAAKEHMEASQLAPVIGGLKEYGEIIFK
jgi:hypothetical protein